MSRKPTKITKSAYIDEYWKKNKAKLEKEFPSIGMYSSEKIFKDVARNSLENSFWTSKKNAKQDMEDMLYERKYGWEKATLRKAKREALDNPFADMRKLNKKIGDYTPYDSPIDPYYNEDITENGYNVTEQLIGYWDIAGEEYVLGQISRTYDDDSPVEYYRYIRRDELGI